MTGSLILMGSGETAPTMVGTHRRGIEEAAADGVVVIDTPFGFQENVVQLTEKLTEFFRVSLLARSEVASLRRADGSALERERFLAAVRSGRYVFAGPGSPSYALTVWGQLPMTDALEHVVRSGGTVCLASAAAVTAGQRAIPVYEIYKVGVDPFWLDGLGLMGRLGLPFTVVPHWNNAEGGNHDTSRCYLGERRLAVLAPELDHGLLGIDEHTAAVFDFDHRRMSVTGRGEVTVRRRTDTVYPSGAVVEFEEILAGNPPPVTSVVEDRRTEQVSVDVDAALEAGDVDLTLGRLLALEDAATEHPEARPALRTALVRVVEAARTGVEDPRTRIAPFVDLLLELRGVARSERRFEESDRIRDALTDLGVEVRDTSNGVEWDLT